MVLLERCFQLSYFLGNHRNILFVNDSPTAEVKLIDFGLSKVYGDNRELTEGVGTIYTMAPQVLQVRHVVYACVSRKNAEEVSSSAWNHVKCKLTFHI